MDEAKRRRLLTTALIAAVLLICPCWPGVWVVTCYDPVGGAHDTAERAAAAWGYRMLGSGGFIDAEPDAVGGCMVRFEFLDWSDDPPRRQATIRLRRGWTLGGWRVLEMSDRPYPDR